MHRESTARRGHLSRPSAALLHAHPRGRLQPSALVLGRSRAVGRSRVPRKRCLQVGPASNLTVSVLIQPGTGQWRDDMASAFVRSGAGAVIISTLRPTQDGGAVEATEELATFSMAAHCSTCTLVVQADGAALLSLQSPPASFPWASIASAGSLQCTVQVCLPVTSRSSATLRLCATSPHFSLAPTFLSVPSVTEVDTAVRTSSTGADLVALRPGSSYAVAWTLTGMGSVAAPSSSVYVYLQPAGALAAADVGSVLLGTGPAAL